MKKTFECDPLPMNSYHGVSEEHNTRKIRPVFHSPGARSSWLQAFCPLEWWLHLTCPLVTPSPVLALERELEDKCFTNAAGGMAVWASLFSSLS